MATIKITDLPVIAGANVNSSTVVLGVDTAQSPSVTTQVTVGQITSNLSNVTTTLSNSINTINQNITTVTYPQGMRLWPAKAYNFVCRGTDDYNGQCTYLYGNFATAGHLGRFTLQGYTFTDVFTLSTLLDGTGTALGGTPSAQYVFSPAPGVLLMEVSTAANKYYLYKSLNNGVNWGNDYLCTNLKPVLMEGYDSGVHGVAVSTISGHSIKRVVLNGRNAILFCWYNVQTGGFNLLKLQVSYDNGSTWNSLFSTNALARHCHLIEQDPYTKEIWIGFGDTSAQSGMIKWDGLTPWPANNFTWAQLATTPGFLALNGQQYRPLAFWFTPQYIYWTSDNAAVDAPMSQRGIMRSSKNANTTVQVSTVNAQRPNTSGGYGITSTNGNWYTIDFPENTVGSSQEFAYDRQIFASFDTGATWKQVGVFEMLSTGVAANNNVEMYKASNYIVISHNEIAGPGSNVSPTNGTAVSTYLYTEVEGNIDEPDQLAPVFWVDVGSANGVDSATSTSANAAGIQWGSTPDFPFLTLGYTLVSTHITYGSRVIVASNNTTYANASILYTWSACSRPATFGHRVQITSDSPKKFFKYQVGATTPYLLYTNTSNTTNVPLLIENMILDTDNTNGGVVDGAALTSYNTNTALSVLTFRNCIINPDYKIHNNLIVSRGTQIALDRTILFANGVATTNSGIYVKQTAYPPIIKNSVLYTQNTPCALINSEANTLSIGAYSAIVERSLIDGTQTGNYMLKTTLANALPYFIKSSYVESPNVLLHSPTVTYNNEIDYSVFTGTVTGALGTYNANGVPHHAASMFPGLDGKDYYPGNTYLITYGTAPTYAGNRDLLGNVSNNNYIGPVSTSI